MGHTRRFVAAMPTRGDCYEFLDSHWLSVLCGATTLLTVGVTVGLFSQVPFYIHRDSALFQHAGWWITEGATLYVDIWDLKPPLIYYLTTMLAVVSVGNMALLHVLSIVVSVAAVIAGVTLLGVLVVRLTDDGFAGLAAGLTMLVMTPVYAYPVAGIRPKYFAFLCAMGGLTLAVEDRPSWSGVVGAAAAGFWQPGAIIAPLVVGIGLQRGGRRGAARAIGGGLAMTAATVAPFVLTGTVIPLVVETVIAPLYGVERYVLDARLLKLLIQFGPGVVVFPIGVYGWTRAVVDDYADYWWVWVGGVGYLSGFFLEFQGAIDLVLAFAFLSLGVGLVVARSSRPRRRTIIAGGIVVLVATSAVWNAAYAVGATAPLEAEYDRLDVNNYPSLPEDPEGWPSMRTIYWEQRQPEHCHYRLGVKQQYFAQETGGSLYQERCGQWPYAEPPGEWLRERLVPW
ncbi:MAG: DolP-mannose mannosyltransferase [Halohasta sp.]